MSQPTVGQVCKQAQAWMNDVAASKYTNQVLLPMLQGAVDELEDTLQENGISVLGTTSALLAVPSNTLLIAYSGTTPTLPADLVDPIEVYEKATGTDVSNYMPLDVVLVLPVRPQVGTLDEYLWEEEKLKFVGATQARDIKLDYRKGFARLTDPVDTAQVIAYNEALPFLGFKTAALAAGLIAQNHTRAQILHEQAEVALARTLNIKVRIQQATPMRRRSWKRPNQRGGGRSIYRTR